jgi:acetate kinase
VAVFDTSFHSTMPEEAYTYGLPFSLYKELGIRRYGFHGTSYLYLTRETARLLNKPPDKLNAIMFHIGAGASVAAIKGGESLDTSMGVTPLEGLVMATRSGG